MVLTKRQLKLILADRTLSPSMRAPGILVNQKILLGGGPISCMLPLVEQVQIDKIFLVDIHLDYVSDVAFLVDSCFGRRSQPFEVWAHPKLVAALKKHFFNNSVWPDFCSIPTPENPSLVLKELKIGQKLEWAGAEVEVCAAGPDVDSGKLSYLVTTSEGKFLYAPEGFHQNSSQKLNLDFAFFSRPDQNSGLSAKQIFCFESTLKSDPVQFRESIKDFLI